MVLLTLYISMPQGICPLIFGISGQATAQGGCSCAEMSIKEAIDYSSTTTIAKKKDALSTKRRRIGSSSAFMEIEIDQGGQSLSDIDSDRLKDDIKRWARAVVAYARCSPS
ncbi:hypothetical protein Nepgr_016079 [Nepenthes gracilis]|uniref:Uncharacterized protein n=1 Tax=Nepenthes gracilis TaxID=150966 RepID=A0AAD3SM30_NEPGR|nr:hypothetical protein Nepgr_016079 [Nepenthes gracilis]